MQFKDVIGQRIVKQRLTDMVSQSRISHALLFAAKEGFGGLPMALAFAQLILCEHKIDGDSCGQCNACKKVAQLVHPDLHFSFPSIPKKSGTKPISTDYIKEWRTFLLDNPYNNVYNWLQSLDADNRQGNITAEECNDILRTLSLKSYEGEYKILILWMPEYLGKEGNKLLKLIEEPPAKTVFIFVTENEELILPTIRSRTQLIKIPPIAPQDIQTALQEKLSLDADNALSIANQSEGSFLQALALAQDNAEDWQQYLRDWLNGILKEGHPGMIRWSEEMNKLGREKQKQFLKYFLSILAQGMRARILGIDNMLLTPSVKDFIVRFNRLTGINQQEVIIQELDKATYYIERNAHAKMLFHALSIKFKYIIQHKTVILTD